MFEYEWLIAKHQVYVVFLVPVEFKYDLYKQFFDGRKIGADEATNNWLWVECELQEWENYLTFVWGSLASNGNFQKDADAMLGELVRFKEYRKTLENPAFETLM